MDIKSIFTTIPGKYVLVLPDAPAFTIVAVTDDYLQSTGRRREELLDKGLFESFPNNPDDYNRTSEKTVLASLEYALFHKESHHLPVQQYDILNDDGVYEERYWSVSNKPLLNDAGEVVYLIHSATDVTEKLKAEQREKEMKVIEKAYNLLINSPVNIAIIKGFDPVIELANEGMLKIWGTTSDVAGKPLKEVIPEPAKQDFFEIIGQVREIGKVVNKKEMTLTFTKNGKEETSYFDFTFQPYSQPSPNTLAPGVIILANDITEQVIARRKVEEINKEVQFVLNVMPQMVWYSKADGNTVFFNQVFLDYTGLPLEKLAGNQWMALLHPEDFGNSVNVWRQSVEGVTDGYVVEHRLLGKNGLYRWFLTRGVPLKNDKGEILKWYGTTTDIQEQKTAAAILDQRVRERTRELEIQNAELEQFTYVTSHDVQEPLRKITIFGDLLHSHSYHELPSASQKYLDKIIKATQRLRLVLADFLNVISLNREEQFRTINLNSVLEAIRADLEVIIIEKKAVFFIDDLHTIKAIPDQVNKLMFNLTNNALKYSKAGEPPVIKVTGKTLTKQELQVHKDLDQAKSYYQVCIHDNGIGFDSTYAEKIFMMFQRLGSNNDNEGTGIGLALCKKIVVNHHGKIWAESRPGEGAAFFVLLPADE